MSLKRSFPFTALPELRGKEEPKSAPARTARPGVVEFSQGRDVAALAKEVLAFKSVSLTAHPGAGKSVRLPKALVDHGGKPVYHAVPSSLLAVSLSAYLKKIGVEHVLVLDQDTRPGKGLNLTTYAWVVGEKLRSKYAANPFEGCIMYADEIHESDVYTYVASVYGVGLGFDTYVRATATSSPERMPMVISEGEVVSETYVWQRPSEWEPLVPGSPWSITSLHGNTLVFVDDDKVAQKLMSVYVTSGINVHRLVAGMDPKDYLAAERDLADEGGRITLALVDSSFRTGHTFPAVTTIIDTGYISFHTVKADLKRTEYRQMYALERYQTMMRGGRVKGTKCVYICPKFEYEHKLCALEPLEMDAAAIIFRMLGNLPPAEIKASKMAVGNVPRDLCAALNGFTPLRMLSVDAMQDPLLPVAEVQDAAVDVLGSYTASPQPSPVKDWFGDLAPLDSTQQVGVPHVGPLDLLKDLQELMGTARTLRFGEYYAIHGVTIGDGRTLYHKGQWKEALYDVHGKPHMIAGMSSSEREDLMGTFLDEYNLELMHIHALELVTKNQETLSRLGAEHPSILKQWADHYAGKTREYTTTCRSLLAAVEKLRMDSTELSAFPRDDETVAHLAENIAEKLKAAVSSARKKVDVGAVHGHYKNRLLQDLGPAYAEMTPVRGAISGGGDDIRVTIKTSGVFSRVSYDITMVGKRSLTWVEDDYVGALANVVKEKGIHILSVKRVSLPDSGVEPARVLQRVRDGHVPVTADVFSRLESSTGDKVAGKQRKMVDWK